MDLAERGLPGEVAPPRNRHAAIDRHSELQQHRRPTALDARDESRVQALGLVTEQALLHLDARGPQPADPFAVGAWIGIAHRDDDAFDPGLADRVDAGRRAAVMSARLEIGVERRAARGVAGLANRVDLCVRFACRVVVALADDRALAHHDRPDERIRARSPCRSRGEAQRPAHVGAVRIGHGC